MSAPTVQPLFAKTILARTITAYYIRPQPYGIADEDQFDPRLLYTAGEQGAWYDPSDFSTLFQDAAGTTPVTAVGQNVGLVLDKSKGLVLGPELVVNGDFGSDSAWTKQAGWSISGGRAVASIGASESNLSSTGMSVSAGLWYEIIYTINSISAGGFRASLGGYTEPVYRTAPGTYRIEVLATTTTGVAVTAQANSIGEIDNVSVRELPGNHAYQTTAASRPTVQDKYLSLDKTDDHLLVAAGGAGTTGFLFACGVVVPAAGTARTIFSDLGTNAGYKLGIDAANKVVFSGGTGAAFTTLTSAGALTAGTKYVLLAWHDGTNLNLSINNVAETPVAQGTVTAGTAGFTIGKDNDAASGYWGDRIYNIVYRKNDTSNAGQRAALYSYIVGKMGGL